MATGTIPQDELLTWRRLAEMDCASPGVLGRLIDALNLGEGTAGDPRRQQALDRCRTMADLQAEIADLKRDLADTDRERAAMAGILRGRCWCCDKSTRSQGGRGIFRSCRPEITDSLDANTAKPCPDWQFSQRNATDALATGQGTASGKREYQPNATTAKENP